MYLATAATGLRIVEKVGTAYATEKWQFYFVKIFGCVVLTSEPLVRSQLSKIFPSEDLGKFIIKLNKYVENLKTNFNLQGKFMHSSVRLKVLEYYLAPQFIQQFTT